MTDVLSVLRADISRRKTAFVAKLSKAGRDDLAADYSDIITMENAAEVAEKRGRTPRQSKGGNSGNGESETSRAPSGFKLSDEVRAVIREIGNQRFRVLQVFEALHQKYPEYITEDKKPSISATLSNLVTYGEISKEIDGQRKVWYSKARLREPVAGGWGNLESD